MGRIRVGLTCLIATAAVAIGYAAVLAPVASASSSKPFYLTQACGGASGSVTWQSGRNAWINIDAHISNVWCGGKEFVRLSWITPFPHSANVGSVQNGFGHATQFFDGSTPWWDPFPKWPVLRSLKVTLCNNWLGWTSCGATASL